MPTGPLRISRLSRLFERTAICNKARQLSRGRRRVALVLVLQRHVAVLLGPIASILFNWRVDCGWEGLGGLTGMASRHGASWILADHLSRTVNKGWLFLVAHSDGCVQPSLFKSLWVKHKLVMATPRRNLGFTSMLWHVSFHRVLPLHAEVFEG